MDATLTQQFGQELEDVNRALEKIEEGTYGLSDLSGEFIAKGRLEAIPEALYTIEEQQRREGERRPQSNLSGRYNRGVTGVSDRPPPATNRYVPERRVGAAQCLAPKVRQRSGYDNPGSLLMLYSAF